MNKEHDLYIKEGKRYQKIAPYDWKGFPAQGVWIVMHDPGRVSSSLICKISELGKFNISVLSRLARHQDVIANVIAETTSKPYTPMDLANSIIRSLSYEAHETDQMASDAIQDIEKELDRLPVDVSQRIERHLNTLKTLISS